MSFLPRDNRAKVALAFVVFYLLSQPTHAADVVNNGFVQLGHAGDSLAQFVNHLGK